MLKQSLKKKIKPQLRNRINKQSLINDKHKIKQNKDLILSNFPVKFNTIEKQQKYMYKLFNKFQLNSFDDWKSVSKSNFYKLIPYYEEDKTILFTTIYPNYPWNFPTNIKKINSIEQHREHVEKLFFQLPLNSLEDWLNISSNKLFKIGYKVYSILMNYYQKDMKIFLSTIYPNFPWPFDNLFSISSKEYFKSVENQKKFLDKLFIKFNLNSFEDWLNISKKKIIQNGGYSLINQYKNDMKFLLSSLYPNFPWDFSSYKKKIKLKSIEEQRKRMDEIFQKLKLKSHDDWFNIPRKKIIKNGGGSLLNYQYKGNLFLLLTTIYPDKKFNLPTTYENSFQSIEKQKKFMDKLFIKLKLKSFDDWVLMSAKKIVKKNGGKNLLSKYEGKIELILLNVYPNYPWRFSNNNHEKLLDDLFIELKLNNFEDWKKIIQSKKIFKKIK